MPDLKHIYAHQAEQYQRLVSYEDYQGNLLPAIQRIMPLAGIDVVETGAGTGRLTCLLAPWVRSLCAFDLSDHMLDVARQRLEGTGCRHVQVAQAEHRRLPVARASADLVISGWSLCYVYLDGGDEWRTALAQTLADFRRFLRPGGKIIIIETLGTGYEQPCRYPSIAEYLDYLDQLGFQMSWVRTDFRFDNLPQAQEFVPFFFGDAMLANLNNGILPECTGLWWQSLD
jgi:ubiquinone/menaquinone biosynthesis C-methylase UbiE